MSVRRRNCRNEEQCERENVPPCSTHTRVSVLPLLMAIGAMRLKLEWTDMVPLNPRGKRLADAASLNVRNSCDQVRAKTRRKAMIYRSQLRAGGTNWRAVAERKEELSRDEAG